MVKTQYNYLNINAKDNRKYLWEKVWVKYLIPKISYFTWFTSLNSINTYDNLKKKGILLPNKCIMCKKAEETIDHFLFHYEYANQSWDMVTNTFQF